MSDKYNAKIVFRKNITDNLVIVKVLPDAGVPDFRSGQYLALGLAQPDTGKLLQRAYSIASSPNEKEGFEFFVALVDDGQFTPQLFSLEEGARLSVARKVVGTFVLPAELPEELLFVATGTGVAPYVSMLRSGLLHVDKVRRVDLVYGVRHEVDFGYDAELRTLEEEHSKFHFWPVVSRDGESERFTKGHVQKVVLEKLDARPEKTKVYLCGNPAMITEISAALQQKGLSLHSPKAPGEIVVENYW